MLRFSTCLPTNKRHWQSKEFDKKTEICHLRHRNGYEKWRKCQLLVFSTFFTILSKFYLLRVHNFRIFLMKD